MTRAPVVVAGVLLVLAVLAAGWAALEAVNAGLAWLLDWEPA